MKYLIILADGMADYQLAELDGQTPLQYNPKPNMNRLAQSGMVGLVQTVPPGLPPGSDVANLSVLGYDPTAYYTGRSPLEAVSMGVELAAADLAFRCNLVTLSPGTEYRSKRMVDYSADEITTPEAQQLISALTGELNSSDFNFYPGISYRHLLVWHNGPESLQLTPPHDISDREIGPYLPKGTGGDQLLRLMQSSQPILQDHPINQARIKRGLRPANSIWLWGQGKKPALNSFYEKYRLKGAVISAVDLAKGLGLCAGLKVIDVPGATGNIHTNFRGKAQATLEAFKSGLDLVYLHIEAPDEAGHRGELDNKVQAIAKIDTEVLGWLLAELPKVDPEFKILLLPDHPTPLSLRTHVADPVPFVIYEHGKPAHQYSTSVFDEESASQTGLMIAAGHQLMGRFIKGEID